MMHPLKISIVQTDIAWENKQENLRMLREKLHALRGTTEIVVLPEMFSTGLTMKSRELAEPVSGITVRILKELAADFQLALCGSFICSERSNYYNRAFFITPEGEEFYYDKRHLFRMGNEAEYFSSGNNKLIISYRGWNICLLVCYVNNEYDLLIYVASWPQARRLAWDTLLCARALENMCYVCGVNRIGVDGNKLIYNGGSVVFSAKGEVLASVPDGEEGIETVSLSLISLQQLRDKFPVWKDADAFRL